MLDQALNNVTVSPMNKKNMVYNGLHDIEDDEHEVLWTRLKPKKLPSKYSCIIIIACIYHPPGADNSSLQEYLITSPDCGIILRGKSSQGLVFTYTSWIRATC